MATKLVETSLHQGLLNEMFEQPENVDALILDHNGYVKVIMRGSDKVVEVGRMNDNYKRYFGISRILSWRVTGGYAMNEQTQYDTNGAGLTPKAYHGLNIEFSTQ